MQALAGGGPAQRSIQTYGEVTGSPESLRQLVLPLHGSTKTLQQSVDAFMTEKLQAFTISSPSEALDWERIHGIDIADTVRSASANMPALDGLQHKTTCPNTVSLTQLRSLA